MMMNYSCLIMQKGQQGIFCQQQHFPLLLILGFIIKVLHNEHLSIHYIENKVQQNQ